jgi:hypothetical protein
MSRGTLLKRVALLLLVGGAFVLVMVLGVHLGAFGKGRFGLEFLTFVTACIALVSWRGRDEASRWGRIVAAVGLTLIAVSALTIQANGRVSAWGRDAQVAEWGTFHYYLGGKYFSEMGYVDLYEQAVIADWDNGEGPNRFREVPRIRDLRDYRFISTEDVRKRPRADYWSDARWEEFKKDVRWFGKQAGTKRWRKIIGDRGYNPPPSYVLVAGTLENIFSIRHPISQTILINLDMLALLLALVFSIRAYGYLRSILVLTTFLLWYGNVNRVYGQIWILDWFAAGWMAAAAWRLKRHGLSGGLIAYAACMRVFPLVLLVGPVVANLPRMIRERRIPPHLLRFAGAAAGVGLLLVAVSTVRYGPSSWQSFFANIAEHNENHEVGTRRFGLKHAFILDWSHGLKTAPKKVKARRALRDNSTIYRVAQVSLLLLILGAMLRRDEHDALLLGAGLFFIGTVASRYYGALLVLLLLIGASRAPPRGSDAPERPRRRRIFDALILMLIWAVYAAPFGGEARLQYIFSNGLWTAWWLALLAMILLGPSLPGGRTGASEEVAPAPIPDEEPGPA